MIPLLCRWNGRLYLAKWLQDQGVWLLDAGARSGEQCRGFRFARIPNRVVEQGTSSAESPRDEGSPSLLGNWIREVDPTDVLVFYTEIVFHGISVTADHWVISRGPDQLRLSYTPYNTVARKLGNALFQAKKPIPKDLDEWAEWDRDAATLERLGWKLERFGFDRVAWGVVPLAELELIEGPPPDGPF